MSNSTNGNLLKIANRVLKIRGRVLTQPKSSFPEVQIGSQIWMSKNLAIDDGGEGISTQTVNYGQGPVVEYYYTWDAAVRVANSIDGWHLPTADEWVALANAVGGGSTAGTYLKSTYGWSSGNGVDTYAFSVFPAGFEVSGEFRNFASYAYFWTANPYNANAWYRSFSTNASIGGLVNPKSYGYSVRLVKDSQ